MKKLLFIISLMFLAIDAHAQSSVTLYGAVNADIQYMSGIPDGRGGRTSRVRAGKGDWSGSILGLKGVEDIGGKTRILFRLEQDMNPQTGMAGAGGSTFNRYATVGASNDAFGTLLFGRELAIANGVANFDPFHQSAWSSGTLVRGRTAQRTSNNISYQSPEFSGLDVYGQYSLSNATGSWNGNGTGNGGDGTTPQGRQDGLQLTYSTALFQVRGIYDEIRDPLNGRLDNPFKASREYFIGANLILGQFQVQAAYTAERTSGGVITPVGSQGSPTSVDMEWGGVAWRASPATRLIAAVYHVNANNGGGNATFYTIGGAYSLSKSTFFNFQMATMRNSKTANFGLNVSNEGPGGLHNGTLNENPEPGHGQTGAYAGIQHMF
jgi:predicted porin